MSDRTKIEWATSTINPIVGCSKVSPGCQHCYAERMAVRLANMGFPQYMGVTQERAHVEPTGWTGRTRFVESALEKPDKWKKSRMIFVCSMGDLFHKSAKHEWIAKVFQTMAKYQRHTFLVLTKRPERMKWFFDQVGYFDGVCTHNGKRPRYQEGGKQRGSGIRVSYNGWPLLNVWLGVTAENQEMADQRIPVLLSIPAAKRFVSIEPILGPMSFRWVLWHPFSNEVPTNHLDGLRRLDWVITGAESGPGRRECNEDWIRALRDQCCEAEVPFFLKQLFRDGKKIVSPKLDGVVYNQYPK